MLRLPTRTRSRARTSGYTLIELMMVVGITGVLASLAIPAFNNYIQKGRTAEATNFLGVIKLREEAYRSEFGSYAGSDPALDSITFVPDDATGMVGAIVMAWPANPDPPFMALGARPDGDVRFGYGVAAGGPGEAVANLGGTHNITAPRADFYFVAQAVTDLNDDGVALTMEITSFTRSIWVSNTNVGWD